MSSGILSDKIIDDKSNTLQIMKNKSSPFVDINYFLESIPNAS